MIPILDARSMRRADRAAIRRGVASEVLMENAAGALAEEILRSFPRWRTVVVACGPGNNGGDGLAAARLLAGRGMSARVFTLGDPEGYRGDAAENARRARACGLALTRLDSAAGRTAFALSLAHCDGVVDALFGTGLTRPLQGLAARVVAAVNRAGRPVVAADVPSGLSSDSVERIGPSVEAERTVAFGAAKVCHAGYPARALCGIVTFADIGIPHAVLRRLRGGLAMAERSDVARRIAPRVPDAHKGTFGRLAVVAGSRGKSGAAVLAARGALRAGAGLVTVFCPSSVEEAIVSALPEAMTRGLPESGGAIAEAAARPALDALREFDAAVVGPGLTTAPGTVAFLERLLSTRVPLVCDADALNAFAGRPRVFASRVVTPHPGEAGRLLGVSARRIQKDRVASARRLARQSRAVVVLKGAASLIAADRGRRVTVNPTGTPLMATAGSGDVLAGAVGALLAAGYGSEGAAIVAVWLHGAAGEICARRLGDAGLLAGELADALPIARREVLHERREGSGGEDD
jgi:NAD(P)H-hydrate epimerase